MLEVFIIRVLLQVRLEVVTVLLLFLGEIAKEVGVVVDLTVLNAVLHTLLTALMRLWVIAELASIELLNLVEETVELEDRLLNIVPRFIKVASIRNRQCDTLRGHLAVNFLVSLMHGEKLLMGLL